MSPLFLTLFSTTLLITVTPIVSSHSYLRGLSKTTKNHRQLQTTTPTVSFCPSTIGSDAGLWADLLHVNDPENYQVRF